MPQTCEAGHASARWRCEAITRQDTTLATSDKCVETGEWGFETNMQQCSEGLEVAMQGGGGGNDLHMAAAERTEQRLLREVKEKTIYK